MDKIRFSPKELIEMRKLEIEKLTFNELKKAYIDLYRLGLKKTELMKIMESKK